MANAALVIVPSAAACNVFTNPATNLQEATFNITNTQSVAAGTTLVAQESVDGINWTTLETVVAPAKLNAVSSVTLGQGVAAKAFRVIQG